MTVHCEIRSGNMKTILYYVVVLVVPVITSTWTHSNSEEDQRAWRHFHAKRHLPLTRDSEVKKRSHPPRYKKKPAGSLIPPLREDDIDNDEIVSVAIGPPLITPRYDKIRKKIPKQEASSSNSVQFVAADSQHIEQHPKLTTNIIIDVITQLGKEFLSRQVSEDFVFGQYVGNAMKNLTLENKLKLQHDVLELLVQYQKINGQPKSKPTLSPLEYVEESIKKNIKMKSLNYTTIREPEIKSQEKLGNETEEWSVLAKLENN